MCWSAINHRGFFRGVIFNRLPVVVAAVFLLNFASDAYAQAQVQSQNQDQDQGQLDLTLPTGGYLSFGGTAFGPKDKKAVEPVLTSLGFGREFVFDTGIKLDGSLNYLLGDGLRSAVGVGFSQNNFNKFSLGGYDLSVSADMGGGTTAVTFKASGYYDLLSGGMLRPFIGAGIGRANTNLDQNGRSTDASDQVFAFKFSTGLDYSLNSQFSFRGEYKYFNNADPRYNAMGGEYEGHSVGLNFSYDF